MGMLQASFDYARDDADARTLAEARVESGRGIEALANALDEDGEALLPTEDVQLLRDAIQKLTELTAGDDAQAITQGTEMLGKASEDFASLRMDAAVRRALAGRQLDDVDQEMT